jgi:magnesium transporter
VAWQPFRNQVNMIVIRSNRDGNLVEVPLADDGIADDAIWIDLVNPTREEDLTIERHLKIAVPTRDDMGDIEESSRFYVENGALYLIAPLLHAMDTDKPTISPISFILKDRLLISVRYCEPRSFANYIARATKPGNELLIRDCRGSSVLLGILESATDRLADILQRVANELDEAGNSIFRSEEQSGSISNRAFRAQIRRLGGQGDFLSKVRESLGGIDRLCVYLAANLRQAKGEKDLRSWIKSIDRDVQSLENHVDFLSNKITFLMDTMVGLISVEQNAIIKIFAVASVALMPPTLIASIYGMNFTVMPELQWPWGYPLALIAMVVATIVPIMIFRWRGWL